MKFSHCCIWSVLLVLGGSAQAQQTDSLAIERSIDSIDVSASQIQSDILRLPDADGAFLYTGKKNEVITPSATGSSLPDKIARQIFAKVPGVFVYDMDGAGNQLNISTRGLDPHRGWEFNIRQNGVITNSDMFGYPASHYSVPLEAVERIELLRGTGALQYGAQLGGMLNFVTKRGDSTRQFSYEGQHSMGSFALLNTYNAFGGRLGRLNYYVFAAAKSRGGYRDGEATKQNAQGIALTYQATANLSVRAEWAHSYYRYRLPGPLTDSMFRANPRQSSRMRNYYSPDIHVPSIDIRWQANKNFRLQWLSSAVLGTRSSVLFDQPATVLDTITAATLQYNHRAVDIDIFRSFTHELRTSTQYRIGKYRHTLAAGAQFMHNRLHRRQQGRGTTNSDYDLSILGGVWRRNIFLNSHNIAVFAENSLRITQKIALQLGARAEIGSSRMSGDIIYYPAEQLPVNIKNQRILFGGGLQWQISENTQIYSSFAQSYRPVLFKDLIPSSVYERVDSNLRNSSGYNAEIGFRGQWRFLRWDVGYFILQNNHRFGLLAQSDTQGNYYTLRTNIGNSRTHGAELFIQADIQPLAGLHLQIFTSTSIMDGRYTSGLLRVGVENTSIAGNKIESVPNLITRNGLRVQYECFTLNVLYSYTAATFADALNTELPNSTGSVGIVPAYSVWDIGLRAQITQSIALSLNVNNVANTSYFTKRPQLYPGAGVWSSDGRSFNITLLTRL